MLINLRIKKILMNRFIIINLFLCLSLVSFQSNADELGEVRIYTSVAGDQRIEVTLIRLGEPADKRLLAYFNTPDAHINGEYNVYQGLCESTRCDTVHYKLVGGKSTNLVSNDGYFGANFRLILPGRNRHIPIYFDEKQSLKEKKMDVYHSYLTSIGRSPVGSYNKNEIANSFQKLADTLHKSCHSKTDIDKNIKEFEKQDLVHLIGMGAQYLREISTACADSDYQKELAKISTIMFLPESNSKPIELKGSKLYIYLSNSTYNPKYEARYWLENL